MKDIIKIAAGLIIVGTLVAVAFAIFNVGKKNAEESASTISNILSEKGDKYATYKDTTILGDELVELIGNSDGVYISVLTGANAKKSGEMAKQISKADATDKSKDEYINPYKSFQCTSVTVNGNGVVTGLTFKQIN